MNEEIEDDTPATDESRSRGPWHRSDPGWDYDPRDPRGRAPATRADMDRAADAALDQWLNRRGL